MLGTRCDHFLLGLLNSVDALVRPERHQPSDRQRRKPLGKLTHCNRTRWSCPMEVIKTNQYRTLQGRLFDHRLKVLEKPKDVLLRLADVVQCTGVGQRRITFEQCVEQGA